MRLLQQQVPPSRSIGTHQTEEEKADNARSSWWRRWRAADEDLTKEEFEKKYTDKHHSVLRVVTVGDDGPEKAMVLEDRHEYSAQPVRNAINAVDAQLRAIRDPSSVVLKHDSTRTLEIDRRQFEENKAQQAAAAQMRSPPK